MNATLINPSVKTAVKRGEVWMAALTGTTGSEQGGVRPVLVIQNNKGNFHAPTTIVAPISSASKSKLPTHVVLTPNHNGVVRDSIVLTEQIRTIDKSRLQYKLAELDADTMKKITRAMLVSIGALEHT